MSVSDAQVHQRGPEQVVFIQNKHILPDYQVTENIICVAYFEKVSSICYFFPQIFLWCTIWIVIL